MVVIDGLRIFAQWAFINSLKASLLIALIFMIQRLLRDRLTAKWQHALWLILIVRLFLPAGFESNLSLYNLFNKPDAVSTLSEKMMTQPISIEAENPSNHASNPGGLRQMTIKDMLSTIWVLGVLAFSMITLIGNQKCWMIIREWQPLTDARLKRGFSECQKGMQIHRPIQLAQLEAIQIPMLYGWLRPVILLPSSQISKWTPDQINHILCHELAHHKRHDILLAHITTILQIMHWFNPLMWLAFYKIRLDREIACDAIALNHLGRDQSRSYGSTILSLLDNVSTENLLPMTVGIVESKKNLKRRLTSIAKFKKPGLIWTLIGLLLTLIIGCAALTEAKKNNSKQIQLDNATNDTNQLKNIDLQKSLQSVESTIFNKIQKPILQPFQENGKWGYQDSSGQVVIAPQYETAWLFSERIAPVKKDGKWGYIDKKGNWIVKPDYEEAHGFNEGLAEVKTKGKWGFIDEQFKLVIQPQFDMAYLFTEGMALVRNNNKFGFINKEGKIVIDLKYQEARMFLNGQAAVRENNQWGFINQQGRQMIPCMYELAGYFSEGLAMVQKNGKFGYINLQNKFVIPPQFKEADHFSEGLAAIKSDNDKYGFIDKLGKLVIEAKYDAVLMPFEEGRANVVIFQNPGKGIEGRNLWIDRAGNNISSMPENKSENNANAYTINAHRMHNLYIMSEPDSIRLNGKGVTLDNLKSEFEKAKALITQPDQSHKLYGGAPATIGISATCPLEIIYQVQDSIMVVGDDYLVQPGFPPDMTYNDYYEKHETKETVKP